jgi:BlaI family transcriptional regulator, penicillinase repressor
MSPLKISAAELDVMRIVWDTPGVAASEVNDRLVNGRDWSHRTVKTLLARLVEKGALRTEADGRRFLYFALIDENAFKADAAGKFVDQVFAGRASSLVAYLSGTRGLSADDIAELEKLLGELKK